MENSAMVYDVIVVGSGAGGLSAAITARKTGLDVLVLEKDRFFGGTTAYSGGVLWIPGNRYGAPDEYQTDTREAALRYLRDEIGTMIDEEAVNAFLDAGPQMLKFFEAETSVRFVPTAYPDYHPDRPGGVDLGRSVLAAPFDARELGENLPRLRPPLRSMTFIGMMFNSSNADIKHFFNVTRSISSAWYVLKRLSKHCWDLARFGRGVQVTSGNALAARLAKSAFDLGIPIMTQSSVRRLVTNEEGVAGVVASCNGVEKIFTARHAVVLACGGFSHDLKRISEAYPHVRDGGEHSSPVPESNTGDGTRMAEVTGGYVDIRYPNAAAWMPVSRVPRKSGGYDLFPHLLDRYKPGFIGVTRQGKRFTNESNSYHDVGAAMIEACRGHGETTMWLIGDHPTVRRYGLGYAKPAPLPIGSLVDSGYLIKADSIGELARKAGICESALEETVRQYNEDAVQGSDRQFGRGSTTFNRFLGDPAHRPNPCVAPVQTGPFYALQLHMGDLGTFEGLQTSVVGEVLTRDGNPIGGLYAVGNDRASIMGGNYPGAGITLGPIMTFAWLTGQHMAARANDKRLIAVRRVASAVH